MYLFIVLFYIVLLFVMHECSLYWFYRHISGFRPLPLMSKLKKTLKTWRFVRFWDNWSDRNRYKIRDSYATQKPDKKQLKLYVNHRSWYSQTRLSGQHWDLIMSIHLGRVFTYPWFILYIEYECERQVMSIEAGYPVSSVHCPLREFRLYSNR